VCIKMEAMLQSPMALLISNLKLLLPLTSMVCGTTLQVMKADIGMFLQDILSPMEWLRVVMHFKSWRMVFQVTLMALGTTMKVTHIGTGL